MKQYASDKVSVILGGTPITGWMDGSFLEIGFNNDLAAPHVGADGAGTMVVNADRSGSAALTLKQDSLSNAVLTGLMSTNANFPIIVKDNNGNSLYTGAGAFIQTPPRSIFAQEIQGRVWTIAILKLTMIEGGNADV